MNNENELKSNQKNEDTDFLPLFEQYENMIWKVIHSLKIYKNLEDYFQIGLIALWEAYKGFDEEKGAFHSYAFSYIRGRILTELRRNSKSESALVYPEDVYWKLLHDENTLNLCEKEILLSYCKTLTENQTKWVLYTFLYDLSVYEIAAMEGVSPSAVKSWRKGAKEKIKKSIMERRDV